MPDSLTHHPDKGTQYTGEQFRRLTADHGMTRSICQSDNAAKESFFSFLKTERTA